MFYSAFMTEMLLQATCVNVLSSNLRLYHCDSKTALLNTKDALHNSCAISHYFTSSFFILLHCNLIIASFVACNTTSVTIYMQGPGVKGHIQIVSRLSHFVRANWPLQKGK